MFVLDPKTLKVSVSCPVFWGDEFVLFTDNFIEFLPCKYSHKLLIHFENMHHIPLCCDENMRRKQYDCKEGNLGKMINIGKLFDDIEKSMENLNHKIYQVLVCAEIDKSISALMKCVVNVAREKSINIRIVDYERIKCAIVSKSFYIGTGSFEANREIVVK